MVDIPNWFAALHKPAKIMFALRKSNLATENPSFIGKLSHSKFHIQNISNLSLSYLNELQYFTNLN